MRFRQITRLLGLSCALFLLCPLSAESPQRPKKSTSRTSISPDLLAGLLPKEETGALRFLNEHPEYDGRNTIVAIFDTGVDPGAPGLSTTPQGQRKIVDLIDATGDGDVDTSKILEAKDGKLSGLTGRELIISPKWRNPSGKYRVGIKAGWDLFPPELTERLKEERKRTWDIRQRERLAALERSRDAAQDDDTPSRKEWDARIDVLKSALEDYDDPGPVYDCVLFQDGRRWRAVVDTDEDGDLRDEQILTDYDAEPKFATFGQNSSLNFSVHIYDDGDTLSLVTVCGEHGTHVAGIVAAYEEKDSVRNGLAPGARIVSVKIGHNLISGMETGAALTRGIEAVLRHKCDLINMSYGEPSSWPNHGRIIDQYNALVREHGIIFVSSAGNSGPALSTVGAPGGTSSAIIGVGAYVSPVMMLSEYTLRDELPGMAYTWTSRGPTLDGARGVDIFAPGGAYAPIPNYSLQPSRQMNGTSMASPNACGNIALLLSGLKAEKAPYTPASILRALQQTAEPVNTADPFAQGPGLLQVDQAFDYCTMKEATDDELIEIETHASGGRRGIYLRDTFETSQAREVDIHLQPYFRKDSLNKTQLDYEVPLAIKATEPWVHVGPLMILSRDGNSMSVEVDPTSLPPGVHTAEILGHDARTPDRGPLVRVPVTVVRCTPLKQGRATVKATTEPGDVARFFFAVPEYASAATLKVKRLAGEGDRLGIFHLVQLVPGQSFEEGEVKWPVNLSGDEVAERLFSVTAGRTLEVCWGHYWSSLGTGEFEFEIIFHGLSSTQQQVSLPSDGGAVRIDFTNHDRPLRFHPKAEFQTRRTVLLPEKHELESLNGSRDRLPDARRSHRLLLTYSLSLKKSAQVTLRCPQLDQLLYESPLEGLLLQVFNEQNEVVATDDMFPDAHSLPKGTFRIEVELRDTDSDRLDKWKQLALAADRPLGSRIAIPMGQTRAGLAAGDNTVPNADLQPGEQQVLWLQAPETPDDVDPGDVLVGTLKPAPALDVISYSISHVVPGSAEEDSQKAESLAGLDPKLSADDALNTFRLARLKSLTWPKDREEIESLKTQLAENPKNAMPLAIAMLHLRDTNAHRKEALPEIVLLADSVIQTIPRKKLQAYFGTRHDDLTDKEKTIHKERTAQREALIDALYRKGRALGYMELPDVVKEHPIENQAQLDKNFAANFKELSRWVDTKQQEYVLLHIRKLRRAGEQGQALQLLKEASEDSKHDAWLMAKKRRDMFGELGWTDWREYEQNWMLRRFPGHKL
ncbi:MAG: S8 family serine peptidase [Planctomycetaceae bacterium]|nr:S8 family serine peptidase [Planctomycetaceae bacterium]